MKGAGRPDDAALVAKAKAIIKRPKYEGDVSEWGKTQLDSFYDDEDAGSDVGPEVSEISSGISPRDLRPRARPFDVEGATQVCVCDVTDPPRCFDPPVRLPLARRTACPSPALT
jgi:hypothetical protein